MGYPIMATPYSQLVGIQALLNVVTGKRYSMVPDENLMYLAGHMGPHPAPGRPGGARQGARQRARAGVPGLDAAAAVAREVRHAHGDTLSDEELILRFLMPDPDVDAMYAAGPVPRHLPVADTPGAEMVVELMRSSRAAYLALDHGDVHLTLSPGGRGRHVTPTSNHPD